MRGQASMEYLVLSLVSLAMLAVSVTALGAIKHESERSRELALLKSSAGILSSAMDEVCSAGYGNRRAVSVSVPLELEPGWGGSGWSVRYTCGNSSLVLPSICEAEGASIEAGPVTVENEDGRVSVKGS